MNNRFLYVCTTALAVLLCASVNARDLYPTKEPPKSNITLKSHDMKMSFGGEIREQLFMYNHARTLRSDYSDYNEFIRHRAFIEWNAAQGEKKYGKPAVEAGVKLVNYLYWQQHGVYSPFVSDPIVLKDLDNITIASNTNVKTLVPLIFLDEAWFKAHFDTFLTPLKDHPTFLQVGFFRYTIGRGLALGFHDDLAIDHLGWVGEGNYMNYRFNPPGALIRGQLIKDLTMDLYFSKWRETNSMLADVMKANRGQLLYSSRTERSSRKDQNIYACKFDYTPKNTPIGNLIIEPYVVHCAAPEQTIEIEGDASSDLTTVGAMFDCKKNNFEANVEIAGQFGHQNVQALDRNVMQLTRGSDGNVKEVYSHILTTADPLTGAKVPVATAINYVNLPANRALTNQGKQLVGADGTAVVNMYNSNAFGNARFRNPYKLENRGYLALADVAYTFEDLPFRAALAGGIMSGDSFPYNEEKNKTYKGFIPFRSFYKGLYVENLLIWDEWVVPRPYTLNYRTYQAPSSIRDYNNLQFIGFGLTWYPFNNKRKKLALTADTLFFWEQGALKKWDKNGTHPDATAETQIAAKRNSYNFKGWLSTKNASSFLGPEIDIKAVYNPVKDLNFMAKLCLFFPCQLYKDLDGQPNVQTKRTALDSAGKTQTYYDSLGHSTALGFILEGKYRF
jgi:hypothetical protein